MTCLYATVATAGSIPDAVAAAAGVGAPSTPAFPSGSRRGELAVRERRPVDGPFAFPRETTNMRIRGERECSDCGTRWSYYRTGSVGCPACGSMRSVGVADRNRHTDLSTEFDLTAVRGAIDDVPTAEVASRARERCREYVRRRGFISGGDLSDLDDTYLAATELRHVADVVERSRDLTEYEELYFLALLREADAGGRPPTDEVPASLRAARGLASADAVRAYRRDLRTWCSDRDLAPDERTAIELLGEHVTRIHMLQGDVRPQTAETLVEATRDIATAVRDGDGTALTRARDRLDRLG